MKAEWRKSGILQLEPESTEDVFKLADFVASLRKDDVKDAPSHLPQTPARAEQPTLQELPPEYGVTLSGSPENPVIENHSGRAVIAYRLGTADQNGRGAGGPLNLLAFSGQPAGIPDGGSLFAKGAVPVSSTIVRSLPAQALSIGQGPILRAILQSVVFADGQFVGEDEEWVFEHFGRMIKAFVEVGLLAKAGAWDQIEALAPSPGSGFGPRLSGEDQRTYFERRLAAWFLVQERKFKGDAAAAQLAEIYSSLPALWK
jgi:hypothetical protein